MAREEARYRWFVRNAIEVVNALRGINYALYKFRRSVEHVSVDLDVLVERMGMPRVVKALCLHWFRVVVAEPYTVTYSCSERGGFIDLYTKPSFAWIVYMDENRLLRDYSEDMEIRGVRVRALAREAEITVVATHAIYKEHLVLLIDCLTLWNWSSRNLPNVAKDLGVIGVPKTLSHVCELVRRDFLETPPRIPLHLLIQAYVEKVAYDNIFRATLLNTIK